MIKTEISLIELIRYDKRSEWTKYLTGGQIEQLKTLLKTNDVADIDNLQMNQLAKNTSEILATESQEMIKEVVETLEKDEDLTFQTLGDNRNPDVANLAPGIYRNVYFYADVISEDKKLTLSYCAPLLIKRVDGSLKIVVPQLITEVKSDTARVYEWMQVLFSENNDVYVKKHTPDVGFKCIDYKVVENADFKLNIRDVNTFTTQDTPKVTSLVVTADDFEKELAKNEGSVYFFQPATATPKKEDIIDDKIVKDYLKTLKIEKDAKLIYPFSYIDTDKFNSGDKRAKVKIRVLVDDKTYLKIKRAVKIGSLNGELIGNSVNIYDDISSLSDAKLFNTYELNFFQNNTADKKRELIKNKLAERREQLDFSELAAFADASQTPITTAWLNEKLPALFDANYDDFELMQTLYTKRFADDFAYWPYTFSGQLIKAQNKFFIYQLLKALNVTNKDDALKALKELTPAKIDELTGAKETGKNALASLLKDIDALIDSQKVNLKKSVYGEINVDKDAFISTFNQLLNRKLVHFDFETISTYFNVVPGQVGKIQLVTQISIANTDENFKMSDNLDVVFDPLKLDAKKDYKWLIDELYNRIVVNNAIGIVYNESFEKNRLLEMIDYLADEDKSSYLAKVEAINDNTFDLMKFYHGQDFSINIPALNGYYSIKKLEPFPKTDKKLNDWLDKKYGVSPYNALAINQGEMAQMMTLNRIVSHWENNANAEKHWNDVVKALKIYCHNDVVNMIKQFLNLTLVNKALDEKAKSIADYIPKTKSTKILK